MAVSTAALWLPTEARAACAPASGNNVPATCTDTTINQGGGAPGSSVGSDGYGTGTEINLTTTVVSGATVTGTNDGIVFNSGAVLNSGTIRGPGLNGIEAVTAATVTNSGTITGNNDGIFSLGTANVTNSGTIRGILDGIFASTANVSNSGTILTGNNGIFAGNIANVSNSGTISALGGTDGIFANITANVTNSGTITGGVFAGIDANTTANVSNSGSITGGSTGIAATTANVINSGTILGRNNAAVGTVFSANVTNSGTITGENGYGIQAGVSANVINSGTITGAVFAGISSFDVTVANSGTITGPDGISALNTATVTNSGIISATGEAISAVTANVINSGTITSTGGDGILGSGNVTVTNSGTITADFRAVAGSGVTVINSGTIAGSFAGIYTFGGTSNVTNSGAITGGTAALQFVGNPDTLTLLPGSIIIGAINLGGGGDTVNVLTGNQNLTFDTLAGATVTSNVPFVVSGNRVVTIDPTPFAMADRNLMDFSRAVFSAVPDIEGSFTAIASAGSGSALAFAGPATNASLGENSLPGLSAYADDSTLPFKSPTVVYGNGTVLWARAFVGERVQDADGALLETHNRFYGGLLGGGWQVRPNLRLGLFAGAGETRSTIDTYGETESTLVFAGLTGRYAWGASFLRFGIQGGHSSNDTTRSHINNNLVPGGIENATASFDGWYVTPEATFGHHVALGSVGGGAYTLTPSLNVRYLHASLDGYTETGTTAPLTVSSRSADSFEERGQLKLTRTQVFAPTEVLKTNIFGGVLADQRVGGDSIDAVLLGQAIPFAVPGDDSVWGGFGGLGLEWRTGRVTLFASAEYLALSDTSSVISGQGGLRIAF